MPLFAVHALDHPDALALRMEHYAAHRAFVESDHQFNVTVVLSGPLQSDDGETMIGSLFIVAAESREDVTKFNQADPFHRENVWNQVTISRFHRRKG